MKTLTSAAVEKLRPGAVRREVRDGGAAGLYLVIQTSGAKSWALRFRKPNGASAKLTLGPLDLSRKEAVGDPVIGDPLTLAAARRLAAEVGRARARGRDVASDFRADKLRRRTVAADTFAAAARNFIEEHAKPKTRRWRETARLIGLAYPIDGGEPSEIKDSLIARWRDKPISEIDGHDIYSVTDEARRLGVPGLGRRNGGLSDARGRKLGRTLSKLFGWLVTHRKIVVNPTLGAYCPPPPEARDRVLSGSEIRWLWSASDKISPPFNTVFLVLLLTGARLAEVTGMVRAELAEEGAIWNLPPARTKNRRPHIVPLPPAARELIARVPVIAGKPGYVFTTTGRSPVSGFSKIKKRLDAAMIAVARAEDEDATIPPWRIHDLRRTAATGMAEIGIAPHIVEAALNHISGAKAGVAGTYNRAQYAAEKKAALERWADHVAGLVAGRDAKVIRFPGGAS